MKLLVIVNWYPFKLTEGALVESVSGTDKYSFDKIAAFTIYLLTSFQVFFLEFKVHLF